MACGPGTDIHQDLAKCSASQQGQQDTNGSGVFKSPFSQVTWNKPVKLNLGLLQKGGMLLPGSAKVTRKLFAAGRNVTKDIQNKAAARKTLAIPPKHRTSFSLRSLPDTYKAPLTQPRNMVNRKKPNFGEAHCLINRRDSKMYQRKTERPVIKTQNISETITIRSTNKEVSKVPAVRSQNHSSIVTSRRTNINGKVKRDIPRLTNLENSVNLLNVDDVEEKILKESSVLKSDILKHKLKNTGGDSASDARNGERILGEQTAINEKLKQVDEKLNKMDEKLNKTLFELADLKEIVKSLSLNLEIGCSCASHCHNTQTIRVNSAATNNCKPKVSEAVSDEEPFVSETDNCDKDSESTSSSLRRSLRLNNKGAQYAYDSLRKSTKLLTTPQHVSTKKTNTPGRISRKVIAQLNELYDD